MCEIILRWIYRKWNGAGAWTGLMWLKIGTGGDNGPSCSIQCGEFVYLRTVYFLKKDSAPWSE
jgi:hypothetical protein